MLIKKKDQQKLKNLELLIFEFIDFCLKQKPKTISEIIKYFAAPRHLKKSEIIKLLKILRVRNIVYYSLYSNKFFLIFSPELLSYLNRHYEFRENIDLRVFDLDTLSEIKQQRQNHDQ